MRQVVLDTETTGLDPAQDHRIIEIGCVELVNRRRTGREFHHYLDPGRHIEAGAIGVHGIRNEDLAGKPMFADIAPALLEFVREAEVIIHNAAFDVDFINWELRRLGDAWRAIGDYCSIVDTLALARQKHPGQKNSLDALCARYHVDNSGRELHGALRDARLLADVYLAMTGGQAALWHDATSPAASTAPAGAGRATAPRRGLRIIQPSPAEAAAHERRLADIARESGGQCIWPRDTPPVPD